MISSVTLEIAALAVSLVLCFALLREGVITKHRHNHMLTMAFVNCITLIFDLAANILIGTPGELGKLRFCLIGTTVFLQLGIFVYNLYLVRFLQTRTFIAEGILYVVAMVCGASSILYIVGLSQSPAWFVEITEDVKYSYTASYYIVLLIPMLMMLFDFFLALSCRKVLNKSELFGWLAYVTIQFICVVLTMFGAHESLYVSSVAFAMLILYTNIHVISVQQLADNEMELSDSKSKLLISQMQPHFMYNALNSIYYLVGKDPKTAQQAIDTFSRYLRHNINSLKNDDLIPIEEEMKHIDAYLNLEKLRFGDELKFELDIKSQGFFVPPLSLQPLVENAVKHGVTQREEGGTVWIRTYEDEKNYYVEIKDDGVGFKAGAYKDDNAYKHAGIFNVNFRINNMCHGSLSVTSQVDVGTTSLVTLPKDGQKRK